MAVRAPLASNPTATAAGRAAAWHLRARHRAALPTHRRPAPSRTDIWCLCASRWAEALAAGFAPKLYLQATHEKTLAFAPLSTLKEYALDLDEANAVVAALDEKRSKLESLLS